jgi:hypothetical protein
MTAAEVIAAFADLDPSEFANVLAGCETRMADTRPSPEE